LTAAVCHRIGAPIVAVSLDLRNFDGSPRFVGGQRLFSDATRFVAPVLSSPIFCKTFYSSSQPPTPSTDAVQRAEFFPGGSPPMGCVRITWKPAT
jgi:hypothetical protein